MDNQQIFLIGIVQRILVADVVPVVRHARIDKTMPFGKHKLPIHIVDTISGDIHLRDVDIAGIDADVQFPRAEVFAHPAVIVNFDRAVI